MDEFETAKKRAMYLLGARDYSYNGLIEKLMNNYSEETSAKVADIMLGYGYINDKEYAKKLARKYIGVQNYGKSRASMMMKQKGLCPDDIDEALSEYGAEDMITEIEKLIRKKYMDRIFLGGLEGKKEMQKVIAALARRGYGYNDIKTALYNIAEESDE